MKREHFLDGLRGWGAVAVLLYHVFCDGLPTSEFARDYLRLLLPFNAVNAVFVFFIVSGFALSLFYLRTGDRSIIVKMAIERYPRLTIPVFAICLLVHLAFVLGVLPTASERTPPFGLVLSQDPTWTHLLRFSLVNVFYNFSFAASYAGPLWTMSIELLGSFIVFTVLLVLPTWGRLAGMSILAIILLWAESYYSLFIIGALLAHCWTKEYFVKAPKWLWLPLLTFGVATPFAFPWTVNIGTILGAVAFTIAVAIAAPLRIFMSSAVSRELARLSFPLYLVHGPVMMIVGAPLMVAYAAQGFLVQIAVILLSFFAAYAFAPVNTLAVSASHFVARLLMQMPTAKLATALIRLRANSEQ